ncbi:DeoR/GlpR family DNA-binding transcription regulator [Listeria fleischmannii]|uniref:DeoR/GlpR transcriptional regulator n=2 Tax=Listeria fleischmannii TaxID=1069827 RepID=A0A841YGV5_9LIST|nr:DeoR/GlpR family DNA-binding transcription regulator [Listeria fleischmannii]EIA19803.1 DNA-binding protein IolR [Listeria fleischmannii subsp. coloradonensis]MBC1399625.1 DeoR/GlpR transcriptional regulator [Listeria fleischmannii]MBC1419619.1 DeoR/GlpR transcriptional regulator [Listeria fleischmannii]MBC1427978.1 DeoR/GlpR transcriptional regulator [Listeria fleischmannii]STY34765.1 Glycerol-3-phosphate regulon repressor [Listeria fleischmannii subsp. coloradonensis]
MKVKRIQAIEDYIHTQGTVSLDDLCEYFGVSKNTIRRDINKIAEKNTIKKVYGGVVSLQENVNELLPFENRDITNHAEKKKIGQAAAQLIEDNDLIFVDSGTTTRYLVNYIPTDKNVTIITNNLDTINLAADMENISIFVIGTTFKRKTKSFVGIENWSFFQKYNVTKAFMAATAFSGSHGVMNSDILEYEVKKRMVEKAEKKILMADHTKADKSALLTYSSLADFDVLVTSKDIPSVYDKYCRENKIDLIYSSEE